MEMQQPKVPYECLETGYELPPASYDISAKVVSEYLEAVDESGDLYYQPDNPQALTGLVPPMAIVAYTIATLMRSLSLPPGTIHTTQEIECFKTLSVGTRINCHTKVNRKQERSNLCLLTIDLNAFDENQELVLSGKSGIAFPSPKSNRTDRQ